jgi:ABC-type amino acid transport substrate-binding protein
MLTRLMVLASAAILFTQTAGCGGTDFGDIGQINGTVTFNGEKLAQGTKVIFMRMDTGYAGFAFTDVDGNYSIEWHRDGEKYDGLPVGTYKVLVEPPGLLDVESLSADDMLDGADNVAAPKIPFDKKYTQTATSGIEFTIKAGVNTCNIELH